MTVRRNPQEHEAHTGQPKFSLAENRGVAGHHQPQRGSEGTAWSTQNNPKHMAGHCFPSTHSPHRLPPTIPGGHSPTQKFWEFFSLLAHSFGGLPETPMTRQDNMSGLKNWAVLGLGHFRYRRLSPPVTSEGRFHPFLTHFLRGEPDSIF